MVRVYDIAHSRAGDKGNTSNISAIAYDDAGWKILQEQLTEDVVMKAFAHIATGPVTRYELPKLQSLNFVIEGALGGGVTRSLAQDVHGKSLSSLMLMIELPGGKAAKASKTKVKSKAAKAPKRKAKSKAAKAPKKKAKAKAARGAKR